MGRTLASDAYLKRPVIPGTHERFIQVNGVRVRYLFRASISGGLPILLLPGLFGFSYSWRHNFEPLSNTGNVYALDFPGSGYSERPREFDNSFAGLGRVVLQFADALKIGQLVLIGTSHGGAIAVSAAAADIRQLGFNSRLIRKLILVAPVNPWSAGRRPLITFFGSKFGWSCARPLYPVLARCNGWLLRRVYGDPSRVEAGAPRIYAAAASMPGTKKHVGRILRSWRCDVDQLKGDLREIRDVPTLLLWGTRDRAILPASAEPLEKCFSQAQVVMIQGAGHLPYEEAPAEFNFAILDFLTRAS